MSASFSQFKEEYALYPAKRADLVKNATAGTEEHYLYRLQFLSQQLQSGEIPVTAQSIDQAQRWIQEAENSNLISDEVHVLDQLKTQVALLAFTVKPELLLKELNQDPITFASSGTKSTEEDVQEDDIEIIEEGGESVSVSTAGTSFGIESLSSTLDQDLVKTETLTKKLFNKIKTDFYNASIPTDAWPYLITFPEMETILGQVDVEQLMNLFRSMDMSYSSRSLEILDKADTSRYDQVLVEVILRLRKENRLDFSDNQLRDLTRQQLEKIKTAVPDVMTDEPFVALWERRIFPDLYVEDKDAAYEDWLERMVAFVDTLSPKFNRHKLAVYLMSLQHDLTHGKPKDKEKFLRYLAIPRNTNNYHVNVIQSTDRSDLVDMFPDDDSLFPWSDRVKAATDEPDTALTNEYLGQFMRESKSTAGFEPYFHVNLYLEPLLAKVMLYAGDGDTTRWGALLPESETLTELSEKTILEFRRDNVSTYLPSDKVVLNLRAKNAKRILVRVFEVKTFEYLQEHNDATVIGQSLNLDGLTPNWEHHIALDRSPLEMCDVRIELPELSDKRGAFVVDVISNGENSTAYFTKGSLDFVCRESVAGHVITVIDENLNKLSDKTSVWLGGHYYKPNGDGDIIVPYRKSTSDSGRYMYLIHDGFATRQSFYHREEDYNLRLACHIDNESLVSGSTAKILIKPTVQIFGNTVVCPVGLLEQVVLTIESFDENGIPSTTTVPDFKIHDVNWSEYNFQVPESLSSLNVNLALKIKVIATGEFKELTASKRINNSSPYADQTVSFESDGQWSSERVPGEILTVLRKTTKGYKVLILGKNGETRTNVPLAFTAEHPLWNEHIAFYLKSDDAGEIHLGRLDDIDVLTCTTTSLSWKLSGRNERVYPSNIHGVVGQPVILPLNKRDTNTIRKIALFSRTGRHEDVGRDSCVVDDVTDHIKLDNGALAIHGLKAGFYNLRIGDSIKIDIMIANAKATQSRIHGLEDYLISTNPMMEILDSATSPLYMSTPVSDIDSEQVAIQLHNWTADTRVCIIASRFVPFGETAFDQLSVLDPEQPWVMKKNELTVSAFKSGRVLGEEYQYILNRRAQTKHWAGNLLTKPSALLTPWSIGDTTMSKESMAGSDSRFIKLCSGRSRQTARKSTGGKAARMQGPLISSLGSSRSPPTLNFLVHPSAALVNLVPDQSTGVVKVPFSALKEGSFLEIFASDGHQAAQQSFVVPELADHLRMEKKDLRFKSHMDPTKHYIGERTGIDLDPVATASSAPLSSLPAETLAASITLHSTAGSGSQVRVINSVSQVYDLMLTLLEQEEQKSTLRKFGFIVDWSRLSGETKKEKFSKWCSHELNLLLYKKDKSFFQAVVLPFLKNKLLKSFMDDYLTDAPLEKYTTLKEFGLLTVMEKCLLAQRVPAMRAVVRQWIKDRVHGVKSASDVRLFQTVMDSNKMEEVAITVESECVVDTVVTNSSSRAIAFADAAAMVDDESEDNDGDFSMPRSSNAPGGSVNLLSMPSPPIVRNMIATRAARMSAPMAYSSSAVSDRSELLMAKKKKLSGLQVAREERSARLMDSRFKPVDLTKEMAETYYYGRQDFKHEYPLSDEPNLFWLDFVQWQESQGRSFLSHNFIVNAGSFTEAMATLALLDVTFKPQDASMTRAADQSLIISSRSPAMVFHSSIKELSSVPLKGSVLVTQQYYSQDEKTEFDETLMTSVRRYIAPGSEFRPLESYGAHVVLMNATPNPMKVHLEVQIPQGSISVNGSLKAGQDIQLSPHETFEYEYGFYFPEQGKFAHYPAHVSNYKDIIAFAEPAVLKVSVPQPADLQKTTDTTTWSHILKRGSQDEILVKLGTSPISSLPVELLIPRLIRDRRFLHQVTSVLRGRQEYIEQVWRVSLRTTATSPASAAQNVELVQEYLQSISDLRPADWFTSKVYKCRPHSRLEGSWDNSFKYLEYFPLINARAHKATKSSTILNDKFKNQYDRLLRLLSEKPKHDVEDILILIVYLLAQDRILEAKDKFVELSAMAPSAASTKNNSDNTDFFQLQYDYLRAYLSLCVEVQVDASASDLVLDLDGVQQVLETYRNYPVERWNKMFKDMQLYVDEILQSLSGSGWFDTTASGNTDASSAEGAVTTESSEDQKTAAALAAEVEAEKGDDDSGPEVPVMAEFKIGGNSNTIMVRHRGVREVTVEYYSIDAETMFSSSPITFSDQGENESGTSGSNNNQSNGNDSDSGSTSYRLLKPNGVDSHFLTRAVKTDGLLMIPILNQYLNSNVMISIRTSPPTAQRTWKAYYSQTILVQCLEQTGNLRVLCKSGGRPVRGGYVKVYAEMKQGGAPLFWKDGYTDLVGRFAYAQVSTGATAQGESSGSNDGGLGNVKRFAVFVDAGHEGCTVKTLPVPPV
ncbi:hypothetical protein BGZ83_011796 [Gryganskiella cystojenkinii]|nr:hypothetical protein BGZ83_011796 [Gryganskiella cystojenkinii]